MQRLTDIRDGLLILVVLAALAITTSGTADASTGVWEVHWFTDFTIPWDKILGAGAGNTGGEAPTSISFNERRRER